MIREVFVMPDIMHYRIDYASDSADKAYSTETAPMLHSSLMEPRKLLQELMNRAGDNTNSLAAKLHGAVKQPQIYKFLHGQVKEPKRSNMQPVADYYKVPVDAFYDHGIAAVEYSKLTGIAPKDQHTVQQQVKPTAWYRSADFLEDDPPPLDPRTRALMAESIVEDELYKCLQREWDVARGYNSRADFTIQDTNGGDVFDLEIKILRLRGRRVDTSQLYAAVGKLWIGSNAKKTMHVKVPMALVVLLQNDENQFEVNSDLFRTLDECVDGGLIASYTVMGLRIDGIHVTFDSVQTAYPRQWAKDIPELIKTLA